MLNIKNNKILVFWSGFAAIAAVALAFHPFTESPGYVFALACSLLLTPGAGHLAANYPSRVRRHLAPFPGAQMPAWRLFLGALKQSSILLAIPLATALLNTFRVPPCNLRNGLLFYLLIPTFGVLFSTAVGLLIGLLISSSRWASASWGVLWIGLAALALYGFYNGSAVFAYGPIFGWFPGAIYDRSIEIAPTLLLYRLSTTIWIAFILLLMASFITPDTLQLRPSQIAGRSLAGTFSLILGLLLCAIHFNENRLGFKTDSADLQAHLPRVERDGSIYLHFPMDTTADIRSRTLRDAAFSIDRIERFFNLRIDSPIHVYLFKNIEEKKRLTGAAETSIAKPWRGEVYAVIEDLPHPVLRHELVHVALAPWGRGPFAVAGRLGGWLPDMGIIEGMAVAAQTPQDFSPDEWCAAMKQEGILPSPATLMGPRFLSTDSSAAYTTVGAFFRYVHSRWGAEALRDLYGGRPFSAVSGKDLQTVEDEWYRSLASVPVSETLRRAARYRFDRPPIIRTRCVHEVSVLLDHAEQCADLGDHPSAGPLYAEAARISGNADDVRLRYLFSLFSARQYAQARSLASSMLTEGRLGAVRESNVREWLADLHVEEGRLDQAVLDYRHLMTTGLPGRIRILFVKAHLASLKTAEATAALKTISPYDSHNPPTPAVAALRMVRAAKRHPDNAVISYLLGRQYFNNGEWQGALDELNRSESLISPGQLPEFIQELQILKGKAAFFSGNLSLARKQFLDIRKDLAQHEGYRELVDDWIARCDYFEKRTDSR